MNNTPIKKALSLPARKAKEKINATEQCTVEHKKVCLNSKNYLLIVEELIPGYSGPSPHEYLDPFFVAIRGRLTND